MSYLYVAVLFAEQIGTELQATEKSLADLSEAPLAGQPVFFRLATAVYSVKK